MLVEAWPAVSRSTVAFVLTAVMNSGVLPPATLTVRTAGSQDRQSMQTHDDLLVLVEKMAPGFGGMFVDSDGRLVVYLLDTNQLPAARSAIQSVFGRDHVPAAGVRATRGQYTVSQLKAWTKRARDLLRMSGVTMVDLDDAKNRVTVGIENRSRRRQVEQRLSALDIPRKAVLIEVIGQIRPVTR
jgi:hypothetical protein